MTITAPEIDVIAIGHARFYLRYADLLPALEPDTYANLKGSIERHGITDPILVARQINNHFDVVDGQHRLRIAVELGLDLEHIPLNIRELSADEQQDLALATNLYRRHLTREQRQALAVKLRQQGKSYRAIADALGTSPATALRDVDTSGSGVSNETPDDEPTGDEGPTTITGADGKQYPATRPAPEPDPAPVRAILSALGQGAKNRAELVAAGIPPVDLMRHIATLIQTKRIRLNAMNAYELVPADAPVADAPADGVSGDDVVPDDATMDDGDAVDETRVQLLAAKLLTFFDDVNPERHVTTLRNAGLTDQELGIFHPALNFLLADGKLELVSPGKYRRMEAPVSESTAEDELAATFDRDAITLAAETDDGAWHRAIEIGRKLVAAGIWDGQRHIEFNAYELHDKLFGVTKVAPADLVEDEDYWFVEWPPATASDAPAPDTSKEDEATVYSLITRGTHDLKTLAAKSKLSQDTVRTHAEQLVERGLITEAVPGVWQCVQSETPSPDPAPDAERSADFNTAIIARTKLHKALLDLDDAVNSLLAINGVSTWYALGPDRLEESRAMLADTSTALVPVPAHIAKLDRRLADMVATGQPYESEEDHA